MEVALSTEMVWTLYLEKDLWYQIKNFLKR